MKFKADMKVNKASFGVNDVVEQLHEATKTYLKKLKRKAPTSCSTEAVKRLKPDNDDHDD